MSDTFPSFLQIACNLFRTLPPSDNPDFDPEEDTLVLVDDAGNDVSFAPFGETPQEGEFDGLPFVEIRATADEAGTEVIYDGSVIALLRDTPVSVLDGDSAWLVNRNALLLVQLSAAPGVAA